MAQITTLQPLDFLKNSRSVINQNFINLNVGLTALSLSLSALSAQGTGTSYPTRNIELDNYGGTGDHINDAIKVRAADVFLGTLSPLLNGNITLSANNGYIKHISDGPGTQLIDSLQNNIYGGNWLEFYRVNSLSSADILEGSAYTLKDLPLEAPAGPFVSNRSAIDALVLNGADDYTSLYFTSNLGNPYTSPGIYIPSVDNASRGSKLELNGPGVIAQELTIGGQLRYNPDNFDGYWTDTNTNFNIKTDTTTARLSAVGSLNLYGDDIFIGTTHPLHNGNIVLSANNGYTIINSDGPGLQIKDNIQNNVYGGNWLDFYRTNTLSSANILEGSAYTLKDLPYEPGSGVFFNKSVIDALVLNGANNYTSLYFTSTLGDPYTTPSIYVPSVANAGTGSKIELNGPSGILTQEITVGGQTRFNPDNFDGYWTDTNSNFNIKTDSTTVRLSADGTGGVSLYGDNVFIGTTHPLHNGNIVLSANNGYTIIESDGPGLQIKDNVQGTQYGGNWLEFYRTNGAPGIFNGTAYTIGDSPSWPSGQATESLLVYGSHNDSSIFLSVYPAYDQNVPTIYIPSINNDLAGYKIEMLGHNGILSRKLTVGGQPTYGGNNSATTTSAINFEIYPEDFSNSTVLSGSQNIKVLSDSIFIGTTHPLRNGNIVLSANNGYTIIESTGTGLQIKDNLQGNSAGGTWTEFYRTNAASGVFVGTAYAIVDVPGFPLAAEEMIAFGGTNSKSSILINANGFYDDSTPAVYVPSQTSNLSGFGVEIIGANGLQTRSIMIGNNPYLSDDYNNDLLNLGTSATNVHTITDSSTNTIYLSTVEPTTTLQIGAVSAIYFADGSILSTASGVSGISGYSGSPANFILLNKTSNQAVVNSSTLTADNTLSFNVTAGNTYVTKWIIFGNTTSSTADYKLTIGGSATTSFTRWVTQYMAAGDTVFTNVINTALNTPVSLLSNSAGDIYLEIDGVFTVNGNGNIQYQFAQSTATAAQSAINYVGSYVQYRQVL